jgi:hypothetical protein
MDARVRTYIVVAVALCVWAGIGTGADTGVSVDATVGVDSVTVGQRFTVDYAVTFPDTMRMVDPAPLKLEKTRVLSFDWKESTREGTTTKHGALTAITLNLEGATIPAMPLRFVTAAGETARASAPEITVPVAYIAADTADLAPLKDQWTAPRSYLAWVLAAVALVVLAALLWWWIRRRRARVVEAAPEPVLPADYVAMTELTRIERLGLLERGEFKEYYTLVVDAVRRYLEARFARFQAMDRTTGEVLEDMARIHVTVEPLEPLLREADLVKFARHVPAVEHGRAAMERARRVVTTTAPRSSPALDDEGAAVEAAG